LSGLDLISFNAFGFILLPEKSMLLYTPPPGVDMVLGGLGYIGGWGRAPAARPARRPSAAARQGLFIIS
jgi:hypothetical protein